VQRGVAYLPALVRQQHAAVLAVAQRLNRRARVGAPVGDQRELHRAEQLLLRVERARKVLDPARAAREAVEEREPSVLTARPARACEV